MEIKPIGERVLIKPVKKETKTKSGIILPESEDKNQGEIIAMGLFPSGKRLPIKKGDIVIYKGYSSEEIEVDGEKYIIVDFRDIIAKLGNNSSNTQGKAKSQSANSESSDKAKEENSEKK